MNYNMDIIEMIVLGLTFLLICKLSQNILGYLEKHNAKTNKN